MVTKYCPVCDRPFTGSTDAAAVEAVRQHLGNPENDRTHFDVYNSEGWWNDYGN